MNTSVLRTIHWIQPLSMGHV